ncbi:MAG: YybH family protein [Gemmatimonadales bacterium]
MKPRSMAPTLTTLAIAFTACETGVAPLTDADVAAIGEVREAYRQAVLAGDAAAIASVYTTDGVEMPPNMPAAEGHDAIQAANESPMDVSEFHITSVETVGFGDFAFDRGTFTFTGMIEGLPAIADRTVAGCRTALYGVQTCHYRCPRRVKCRNPAPRSSERRIRRIETVAASDLTIRSYPKYP